MWRCVVTDVGVRLGGGEAFVDGGSFNRAVLPLPFPIVGSLLFCIEDYVDNSPCSNDTWVACPLIVG